MVRVGGGWDTLEHYLDKHDPCRCSSSGQCLWRGCGRMGGRAEHSGLWHHPSPATCSLTPQPTARPSPGLAPSPHRGCRPPPALAQAAQPLGVSGGAPGQR